VLDVRILVAKHSDRATLADDAAHEVLRVAAESIHARGVFRIALAGGTTPRETYERLATMGVPSASDAARWHMFFGDERMVPLDDSDSNCGMASKAWLSHSAIPPANVHPVPTESGDARAAAAAYEAELRQAFAAGARDVPAFDLILLGIGADGHTASLFPGSDALAERTRLVVAARAPMPPTDRVTLTIPVLNAARNVRFLVAGAEKAPALRKIVEREDCADATLADELPARLVHPASGSLVFLVDAAAASELRGSSR
jgi:6-phosphogluconolactonase